MKKTTLNGAAVIVENVFTAVRNLALTLIVVLLSLPMTAQPPDDCACTDQINVNLDGQGKAQVFPVQIIKNLGCLDDNQLFQLRDVGPDTLIAPGPIPIGFLGTNPIDVDCSHIGYLKAEVSEVVNQDTFMQCWGYVLVEDKTDPVIVCPDPITIGCNVPNTPFDTDFRVEDFVWEGCEEFDGVSAIITIPTLSLPSDAVIQDVNLKVVSSHLDVGDVRIDMRSPATGYKRLVREGSCTGQDIDVFLDDEAPDAFNCSVDAPAIDGLMQVEHPTNLLSDFNGPGAVGDWRVRLWDIDSDSDTGVVTQVILQISYTSPGLEMATATDNCEEELTITWEDSDDLDLCTFGTIIRTWTATDPNGNSDQCEQLITVESNVWDFPDIKWPKDIVLSCEDHDGPDDLEPADLANYNTNGDWFDVPRLFPADHVYCSLVGQTHEDLLFDQCEPYGFKIRRVWTVVDWCGNLPDQSHVQVIKVVDTLPPTFECQTKDVILTVENNCVIDVRGLLPQPFNIEDNCADPDPANGEVTISMHVVDEFGNIFKDLSLAELGIGNYTVFQRITDICNNFAECSYPLTILDLDPPTPICDQNTTVSVGWDCTAHLCYQTVDDGSYDNCPGDLTFGLRRMDDPDALFTDCIEFDGDDVGDTLMVIMRVWDISDNYNDCMVNVVVQDKLPPRITCPQDITLICSEDHEDLDLTGEATGFDNCDDVTINHQDTDGLNDCGVGVVLRTWTVTDPGGASDQCVQTITKIDNLGSRPDILFPADITLNCPMDVSNLDPLDLTIYNIFDADNNLVEFFDTVRLDPQDNDYCGNIFIGHNDKNATECEGGFTVQRVWKALDLCYPDLNEQHVQFIYVIDNVEPILAVPADITAFITGNNCETTVSFGVTTSDNCSDNANITVTNTYNAVEGTAFSDVFAAGEHTITFTAEDDCGNTTEASLNVTVIDQKAPQVNCLDINVVLKSTGVAWVTAQMLNAGSTDNCTSQQNLEFFLIDPDTGVEGDSVQVDCVDFCDPINNPFPVQLVAEDADGNRDTCLSFVTIQEGVNNCPSCQPVVSANIGGHVDTEIGDPVEEVIVEIDYNGMTEYITEEDGAYMFPDLPVGADYMVTAIKDKDPLNGVSTIDIVLIRQHILGIKSFVSPYTYVAADINNNGGISTIDIVQLRQLILGITPTFTNNTSWRFVDASYIFRDPINPLNDDFPEFVMNYALDRDQMQSDFVAVKVGDVNGTAISSSLVNNPSNRSNNTLELLVDDQEIATGKTQKIDVKASDFTSMVGFQFTMEFDASVKIVGVEPGNLPGLNIDNFGTPLAGDGIITTSWDNADGVSLGDNEVLFSVFVSAHNTARVSQIMNVSSRVTLAEAYTADLDVKGVSLRFGKKEMVTEFTLYQNIPNPFSNATVIGFNLPQQGAGSLRIMDVSGKTVRFFEADFAKGYNEIMIDDLDLVKGSVYYYQLSTQDNTATKKMVLLQ